jgi:hypothetical protein
MTTTTPEADVALATVVAYCGWHIAPSVTEDVTLDGTTSTVLRLPTLHLTSLDTLTISGVVVDVDDTTAVQWSEAGYLRCSSGFGALLRGVVVGITHGYDAMPLDVQAVIDGLASRAAFPSSPYVQVGQVRVATDASGMPIGGTLTSVEQMTLDRYRLPPYP